MLIEFLFSVEDAAENCVPVFWKSLDEVGAVCAMRGKHSWTHRAPHQNGKKKTRPSRERGVSRCPDLASKASVTMRCTDFVAKC